MVAVHRIVGLSILVVAGVAVVWGATALVRGTPPAGALQHVLALVQTLLIAQVALGLLLLSGDHRAREKLHYAYGAFALAAVLSPWLYAPAQARRRLAWFVGATLVAAALAVRAYLTAT